MYRLPFLHAVSGSRTRRAHRLAVVLVFALVVTLFVAPQARAAGRAWGAADAAPAAPAATPNLAAAPAAHRTLSPSLFRIAEKDGTFDPVGDTFGTGGNQIDIVSFFAYIDDEFGSLVLISQTLNPFSAPDSGAANALAGYVDLDTDQDGSTGDTPWVDALGGGNTGMGNELYVDLFSYSSSSGDADLVDDVADVVVGRVPVTIGAGFIVIDVPLSMLGDDGFVDTAAILGNPMQPTDIVPNDGALSSTPFSTLLNGNRFAVDIEWRDPFNNTGYGRLAVRSADSANFWFFRQSNWEVLLKVLNGCPVNGHYWVFFAATTNVEFTITVTDLDTSGNPSIVYGNPLGHPANAVTDTQAFATCP